MKDALKFSVAHLVTVVAIAALAALGGAAALYSELDDAPGGVLIGLLLIVGAVVLGLRATQRRG